MASEDEEKLKALIDENEIVVFRKLYDNIKEITDLDSILRLFKLDKEIIIAYLKLFIREKKIIIISEELKIQLGLANDDLCFKCGGTKETCTCESGG